MLMKLPIAGELAIELLIVGELLIKGELPIMLPMPVS